MQFGANNITIYFNNLLKKKRVLEQILRPVCEKLVLLPIANRLRSRLNLQPNTITFLALLFGGISATLIALKAPLLAILCLLLSGLLDSLDGTVARLSNKTSDFGCVLDIVSDRVVEFGIILGLYFYEPNTRATLCLLMLGSIMVCVTSFLVVGLFIDSQSEKSFYYSPGLIERPEAFIFFLLMIMLPSAFAFTASMFCVLVITTSIIRLKQFYLRQEHVE